MDTNKLLAQIRDEYQLWYNYVRTKRIQYRNRLIKYDQQKKDKNKINIHLIANTIDTLISTSWNWEWLSQKFVSRDWFLWVSKAQQLNYVAKFDASQQHYQQLFYQAEQDRYFFWVWVMIKQNFDEETMSPNFITINPITIAPDPYPSQTGLFDAQNYRFLWFMLQTSFYDLRADDTINKEALYQLAKTQGKMSSDSYLDKIAEATRGNYIVVWLESVKENFTTEIYNHFTIFEWKKYLVRTNVDQSLIYSVKEIKPVFKSEKENPSFIKRPFALVYYEPLRWDFFGKSICDRLEDKQDAISVLMNLNLIKAKKEALWGDFLVNSRIVKNRQDLIKPTIDSRYIVADVMPGESLGNAMMEVPRSQIKPDSVNMIQTLYNESAIDSSVDKMQMWIMPDKTMTKAENQNLQNNSNVRSMLKLNIASWWYKMFWTLWYREYCEKFGQVDKKFIVLNSDFERQPLTLKRQDFISDELPYIEVGSVADIEAIDTKKLQMMQLESPQFMQSSAPEISKIVFKRNLYRLMGWSENTINVYLPLTPSERKAKEFIDIVNLNQVPKSMFSIPWLDLFTCYIYIQQADNTKAKDKTLQILVQAMIDEWLWQYSMQWESSSAWNQATWIQMAQSTQWQNSNIVSRQDVLAPK